MKSVEWAWHLPLEWAWLMLLCLESPAGSTTPPAGPPLPQFTTPPANFTVPAGSDVKFPCHFLNLGGLQIVWRKGYDIISAGDVMISRDRRLSLTRNKISSNLGIQGVDISDVGAYSCQFTSDSGVYTLLHHLTVLVPARVWAVPGDGRVEGREGSPLTLGCNATGEPTPNITWTKKGGGLPAAASECNSGSCLHLSSVRREYTGEYVCQAENGVGDPATASIHVHILYPPSIEAVRSSVQGGSGRQLTLACQAVGNPVPVVFWYFEGRQIMSSDHGLVGRHQLKWDDDQEKMEQTVSGIQKLTYSITLERAGENMFGNYTCKATNSVGTARSFIEVHGRPSSPTFLSGGGGGGGVQYSHHLQWSTLSYFSIIEYRILYKKAGARDWMSVNVEGTPLYSVDQEKYEESYQLQELDQEAQYECILQARNRYGWSEPSKIYVFHTLTSGIGTGSKFGGLHSSSSSSSLSAALTTTLLIFL